MSVRELFSIGIGPSASHTVGPMRAGRMFAASLAEAAVAGAPPEFGDLIEVTLHGALGATGAGHGTPAAVVAGLAGLAPDTCDPAAVRSLAAAVGVWSVVIGGRPWAVALRLEPAERLARHPNALTFRAGGLQRTYYSVGGGFVVDDAVCSPPAPSLPFPFANAAQLLESCRATGWPVSRIALANERALAAGQPASAHLDEVWRVMAECVAAGLAAEGTLPGRLRVARRAGALRRRLETAPLGGEDALDWLQAFAMAVSEQNAAGERVVTAPTNGAAGIVPAVGEYYLRFTRGADARRLREYLLTAGAVGSLCKANASISGAEVGCQGEVGTAAAMAAAGLAELLGGTPAQVENAAEIAIEHHLGLTCDPIDGLVQIPCIERNSIAAATAVRAARTALLGDGAHVVSLDAAIETMRQVGADMSGKYKETATGGLALNVVEC
ncbi:MAG: L-serine ammonia-lyase [Bifidobacteriaceae bacterium]|nr:L-serine ammonia-lyase [Bifidobacteriaceae bacterium]